MKHDYEITIFLNGKEYKKLIPLTKLIYSLHRHDDARILKSEISYHMLAKLERIIREVHEDFMEDFKLNLNDIYNGEELIK